MAIKIKTFDKMKQIMLEYYLNAKSAKDRGQKVAWITSGGPVELLTAMDIIPIYPENHGAMIGSAKMGGSMCAEAEALGYSKDLCSYARVDITQSRNNSGPIGGLPAPDMLICCTNICGTVIKWYEVQARYYNAPLFVFDTPTIHKEFGDIERRYVDNQVKECISFLESICNIKFDYDKLEEVGMLSKEAQRLWDAILRTMENKPSPITSFDAFTHLAMIVTLRGTQTCVDYYKELLQEIQERISNNIAAIPNEKHRLLWNGIPIWHHMKWFSNLLEKHNACIVTDIYTTTWSTQFHYLKTGEFLKGLADVYSTISLNMSVDLLAERAMNLCKNHSVNGAILPSNRSCKPYSLGQYDMQKLFKERINLPSVVIEGDMTDERTFSEAQVETRLEAFFENLDEVA